MDRPLRRRSRARGASLLLSVGLLGAALNACTSAPTIPKDIFLTRGNEICVTAGKDWDEKVKDLPDTSIAARETYVKKKLAPVLESVIVQLRTLGYPPGDQEYLESIYSDAIHEINKMKDRPSTNLLTILIVPFAKPAQRFTNYGLDKCGKI